MVLLIIIAIIGSAIALNQFLTTEQNVQIKKELDSDPRMLALKNKRLRR